MKSERRHDLKINDLTQRLEDFPTFLREYGSRILLVFLIGALVVVLIINWTRGRSESDIRSRTALTNARQTLERLRNTMDQLGSPRTFGIPGEMIASFRDNIIKEIDPQIATALESSDPAVKADAQVVRGDFNLLLAIMPPLPGSETRPSLNGDRNHDELLRVADDAYSAVVKNPPAGDDSALRNARFGLASISEDRHDWDKARQYYQQIIDDSATQRGFKDMARERMDGLSSLQKPLMLGTRAPAAPTSAPTLESLIHRSLSISPSTSMPSATPEIPSATMPATRPSAPATRPTTAP